MILFSKEYSSLLPALLLCATFVLAQDDSQQTVGGRPIENVIVDRDMYVNLIAESRFTDDEKNLLAEDINYQRFPSRIYDSKVVFGSVDRFAMTYAYSFWENEQDLDIRRKSLSIRVPLNDKWSIYPRYLIHEEDDTHRDYYSVAFGGWVTNIYTYTQLRYTKDEEDNRTSQVYEYLSWQPKSGAYRIGVDGSANTEANSDKLSSWHAKVFGAVPIIKDRTYLHLSALHLDYIDLLQYDEYQASIYQVIGDTTSIRFSYRYYEDSDDLYSHAYGVKVKHYFHPRFGAHIGYRRYEHSEGANLDTAYGGFNLLL